MDLVNDMAVVGTHRDYEQVLHRPEELQVLYKLN